MEPGVEAGPGVPPSAFLERSLLDPLLPRGISVVAIRKEASEPLFPEEEQALCSAVEGRRREFVTGRACAREALMRLGWPRQPLPPDHAGAPRWPAGAVGSITHCSGFRAAAVGAANAFAAVGIDTEPDRPLPAGLLEAIAIPVELGQVRELRGQVPDCNWDRLLFSAKESVYKAWYSLTGAKLGFEDAEVVLDTEARGFSVRLRVRHAQEAGEAGLVGRWSAEGGLVATAIAVAVEA